MVRKGSRRRNTRRRNTRRRRRYPSRSVSKKSGSKPKIKWKKTKLAAATLATIAVAFGLYKWRSGRQVPDITAAKEVLKKTTENSNVKSNQNQIPQVFLHPSPVLQGPANKLDEILEKHRLEEEFDLTNFKRMPGWGSSIKQFIKQRNNFNFIGS